MNIKSSIIYLITTIAFLIIFIVNATYYFENKDSSLLQFGSLDEFFLYGTFWGLGWILFTFPLVFFSVALVKAIDKKSELKKNMEEGTNILKEV